MENRPKKPLDLAVEILQQILESETLSPTKIGAESAGPDFWHSIISSDFQVGRDRFEAVMFGFQKLGLIKIHSVLGIPMTDYKGNRLLTAEGEEAEEDEVFIDYTVPDLRLITDFIEKIQKNTRSLPETLKTEVTQPSSFDDSVPHITIGEKRVGLPPFKNEHFLCREIFKHPPDTPIDWSLLCAQMTGHERDEILPKKEAWRQVYDTMVRINKRVLESGVQKQLLVWRQKTIRRNY